MRVADVMAFKAELELSSEAFREITGINVHRYRRGRLCDPLNISQDAIDAVTRCRRAYVLAIELCGDRDRALDWLYAESPMFDGEAPIGIADRPEGLASIERTLATLRAVALAHVPELPQVVAKKPLQPLAEIPARCRIAEGLRAILQADPTLSKAEIARRMIAHGFPKFDTARASRLSLGYADATREEVKMIAQIFDIPTSKLIS